VLVGRPVAGTGRRKGANCWPGHGLNASSKSTRMTRCGYGVYHDERRIPEAGGTGCVRIDFAKRCDLGHLGAVHCTSVGIWAGQELVRP
jgi:hypothetical protein